MVAVPFKGVCVIEITGLPDIPINKSLNTASIRTELFWSTATVSFVQMIPFMLFISDCKSLILLYKAHIWLLKYCDNVSIVILAGIIISGLFFTKQAISTLDRSASIISNCSQYLLSKILNKYVKDVSSI